MEKNLSKHLGLTSKERMLHLEFMKFSQVQTLPSVASSRGSLVPDRFLEFRQIKKPRSERTVVLDPDGSVDLLGRRKSPQEHS